MSEEEIFKILEKACILDKNCEEVDCLLEEDLIAIRELVSLYKKQKEKLKAYEIRKNNVAIIMRQYGKTYNIENKYISKYKIREKIKELEELYEKEMKPYQTEYGLNLSLLTKKEKEEVINKRNSLLTQIATLKDLLEEK